MIGSQSDLVVQAPLGDSRYELTVEDGNGGIASDSVSVSVVDTPPPTVSSLLAKPAVRRRDDGGLAIEAPPEAADGPAALFEGVAQLLRTAAAQGRS